MSERPAENATDVTLARMLWDKPQAFDAILKFYTEQFKYSASQRISTIQYFVAAFAFLTGGYTTLAAKTDHLHAYALSVVALTAYLLTIAFARLDKRNKQIVELDEQPLKLMQAAIAAALEDDDPRWHSFALRDATARTFTTYGQVVPFIYGVAAAVATAGVVSGLDWPLPMQAVVVAVLLLGGHHGISD